MGLSGMVIAGSSADRVRNQLIVTEHHIIPLWSADRVVLLRRTANNSWRHLQSWLLEVGDGKEGHQYLVWWHLALIFLRGRIRSVHRQIKLEWNAWLGHFLSVYGNKPNRTRIPPSECDDRFVLAGDWRATHAHLRRLTAIYCPLSCLSNHNKCPSA
jgi:hypothetical protein